MATSSIIAKKNKDQTFSSIYSKFNGDRVGKVLKRYYGASGDVDQLISGGDVYELGDSVENTIFYTSIGESGREAIIDDSFDSLIDSAKIDGDFIYIFIDGKWHWSRPNTLRDGDDESKLRRL